MVAEGGGTSATASNVGGRKEDAAGKLVVLEGWAMKRSRTLGSWRARWLTLQAGDGSRWALETSAEIRGSSQSEVFELERVLGVRAVEESHFGRPHCFIVEYFEGQSAASGSNLSSPPSAGASGFHLGTSGASLLNQMLGRASQLPGLGGKMREVGIQASSSEECERWVAALQRAAVDSVAAAAKAAEAKAAAAKALEAGAEAELAPEAAAEAKEEGKGKAKGKGKGPPPPPPAAAKSAAEGAGEGAAAGGSSAGGKGKGKGKGAPGPAPGAGKGKGKEKGKDALLRPSKPEDLPFGRRMTMWGTAGGDKTGTAGTEGTVFDGLLESGTIKVEDNIKALNSVFMTPRGKPEEAASPRMTKELSMKPKAAGILPQREAQNVAIVLRCMPVSGPALVSVLESLRPGPFDAEKLQRLDEILPKPEQLKALKAYRGPLEALRDVERQLLPLAGLERLPQRLRVLRTAAGLEQQQEFIAGQLGLIQAACAELRSSRTLRHVFAAVLVMFNYVNFGSAGAQEAKAFDMATLVHLDKFKAEQGPFKNFNGLHFVVTRLLLEGSGVEADSLRKELEHLPGAEKVNLVEVQASISSLQREADFLHEERAAHPTAYGGQPPPPEPPPAPAPSPGAAKAAAGAAAAGAATGAAEKAVEGTAAEAPSKPDGGSRGLRHRVSRSHGNILKDVRNWMRTQALPAGHLAPAVPELVPELPPPPAGSLPPALLLLGDPDAPSTWRQLRVEVPAPGLLLLGEDQQAEEGGGPDKARYAVVAGADIVPFESPLASLEARGAALEAGAPAHAFELQGVALQGDLHAKARLWLAAEDAELSGSWLSALRSLAAAPGTGFLWVKDATFGIWRWRWATLYSGGADGSTGSTAAPPDTEKAQPRLLVWHRTPGELLRREPPIGGLPLPASAEVQTFEECGHSEASRCPNGFRLMREPGAEGQRPAAEVLLCAGSRDDMDRWVRVLRGAAAGEEPAGGTAAGPEPAAMEDVFSWISSATGRPVGGRPDAGQEVSSEALSPPPAAAAPEPKAKAPAPPKAKAPASPKVKPLVLPKATAPAKAPAPAPKRPSLAERGVEVAEDSDASTATETSSSSSSCSEEAGEAPAAERRSRASLRAGRSSLRASRGEELPLHQLGLIAHRVDACTGQLTQNLDATTAECRRLLAYFRQQQHDASLHLLSQQVQSFFATIRAFSAKLRQAFFEVAQHREACRRRGQPDPFSAGGDGKENDGKDWHALSLFDFQGPLTSRGLRSTSVPWQAQLQVKQSAKAAVAQLVEASLRRLCARWLLERATLKAAGSEVPELGASLAALQLALEAPAGGAQRPRLARARTSVLARQSTRRPTQLAQALFTDAGPGQE